MAKTTVSDIFDNEQVDAAVREWQQKEGTNVFKIEKGIPLPAATRHAGGRKGESKYPTAQLEVDESYVVSGVKKGTITTMVANVRKQFPDRKFAVRAELGEGYRIYRVK